MTKIRHLEPCSECGQYKYPEAKCDNCEWRQRTMTTYYVKHDYLTKFWDVRREDGELVARCPKESDARMIAAALAALSTTKD